MPAHPFSIPVPDGVLSAVLHRPSGASPPLVVVSHGLLSFKDSEKFVELGERLERAGIASLRFDYRGCGESCGDLRDTTVTQRLADLEAVLRWVDREGPFRPSALGLMGSSLGGYLSLLAACRCPGTRAVVVWSTPHTIARRGRRIREELPQLGPAFFDDLPRHDVLASVAGLRRVLIVHGECDELVPLHHARTLFATVHPPKRLEIVPGGDHRLSRREFREPAYGETIRWFTRFLSV